VQGWLECIGPTTAEALARRLGLPRVDIEIALAQLEAEGVVLQGQFEPQGTVEDIEWCDRRLLARIHRRTINKLRRDIRSVSAADLIRFLFRWQHVYPGRQLHGQEGVLHVIRQLQGLELPAPSWERDVLPARVEGYKPSDLEELCLSGILAWGRLRAGPAAEAANSQQEHRAAAQRPTRSAPLGFALREVLSVWMEPLPADLDLEQQLSRPARQVLEYLTASGASFQSDIQRKTGLLASQVEEALWELVAQGLVAGDGLAGLRSLLLPPHRRRRARRLKARRGSTLAIGPLGRWSVLERGPEASEQETEQIIARQLLSRYGIVFRELLARETRLPPWRRLLRAYREMELRGEIRGGRFVDGFVGEQFALPEAVDELRAVRREDKEHGSVLVAASDPLNLVGILTPGERVSPLSRQMILFERGVPVEIGTRGAIRHRLAIETGRLREMS